MARPLRIFRDDRDWQHFCEVLAEMVFRFRGCVARLCLDGQLLSPLLGAEGP
jgi:hypothetical protein